MTEIIIVRYNVPDYEQQAVGAVFETVDDRKTPYHITYYDNYEKDENLSVVWNRLIKRSNAEYICLLNNDTAPQGDWLEKLLSSLKGRVGAVGPISNSAGGHQGGHKNAYPDVGEKECTMLSGFCVVFPKKVWEELGGFDEKYHLYGEDSDFFRRMREKYKLITRFDTFVWHKGKASTPEAIKRGKDIESIKKESSARYQQ